MVGEDFIVRSNARETFGAEYFSDRLAIDGDSNGCPDIKDVF
jgi:hypothetical protein